METLLNLVHTFMTMKIPLNPIHIKNRCDSLNFHSATGTVTGIKRSARVAVNPDVKLLFLMFSCGLVILEGLAKPIP